MRIHPQYITYDSRYANSSRKSLMSLHGDDSYYYAVCVSIRDLTHLLIPDPHNPWSVTSPRGNSLIRIIHYPVLACRLRTPTRYSPWLRSQPCGLLAGHCSLSHATQMHRGTHCVTSSWRHRNSRDAIMACVRSSRRQKTFAWSWIRVIEGCIYSWCMMQCV